MFVVELTIFVDLLVFYIMFTVAFLFFFFL